MKLRIAGSVLAIVLVPAASASLSVIGFEPPDYPVGALSNGSWSGLATKTVTDSAASEGVQALAISGSGQRAEFSFTLTESDSSATVAFDFCPSAYGPPADINFQAYGIGWLVGNDGAVAAGVRFYLEDWDSFPWDPAPASAFKVQMVVANGVEEVVGTFVAGTWYRYVAVIDWANDRLVQTLTQIGGGEVASRNQSFTASGIASVRFYSPQTFSPTAAHVDRIAYGIEAPASGYGVWSADPSRFTPEQVAGGDNAWDRDPDRDGLKNLVEYALALDPSIPDAAGIPVPAMVGGNLTLAFTIPEGRADLTYHSEASTDLGTWSPVRTDPGTGPGPVSVVIPADGPGAMLQLRVVLDPD